MDLPDFMIFRFAYLQMDILFSRIQIVSKEFVTICINKFQLYIYIYNFCFSSVLDHLNLVQFLINCS